MKPERAPLPAFSTVMKPMARADRVTLYEREVRLRLSEAALEILLDGAEVLSEGERVPALRGGSAFYGSTMLTIDLARAAARVREGCDDGTAREVGALMATDGRVARRLKLLAEREAIRLAGMPLRTTASEVRVRTQGPRIFVDVDFEGAAL